MDFGSSVRQSKAHRGLHSPCLSQGSRGFTLIELIIVVVIVGIFAALAAPSFTSLIHKNNVTTTANELYDLLQYSRGEAASRGTSITISPPGSSNSAWNGDIKVILTNQALYSGRLAQGAFKPGWPSRRQSAVSSSLPPATPHLLPASRSLIPETRRLKPNMLACSGAAVSVFRLPRCQQRESAIDNRHCH